MDVSALGGEREGNRKMALEGEMLPPPTGKSLLLTQQRNRVCVCVCVCVCCSSD